MLTLLLGVAFLASLVALSLVGRREQIGQRYLIGDRKVGSFRTATALVAGFRDGAGLSAWVALAIGFGLGAMWLWAGLASALVAVSLISKAVRRQAASTQAYSLNSWVRGTIGPVSAVVTAGVLSATAFLYTAAQFAVSAKIAASIFGVSGLVAVGALGVTICVYIALGGYLSVIRTDVFQWAIITVICLLVPFSLAGGMPSLPPLSSAISVPFDLGIGMFGIAFLVTFSGGDTWQRVMSTASDEVATSAPWLAGALYFLISLGLVVLGVNIAAAFPDVQPDQAFVELFHRLEGGSLIWAALGLLVAASAISTVDTQVYVFATAVAPVIRPNVDEDRQITIVRWASVLFTAATALLALTVGNVVEFLFSAVTLVTILAPAIVYGALVHGERPMRDRLVFISIMCGMVVYVFMFAMGAFQNILLTVVPSLVASVSLVAGLALQGLLRPVSEGNE